MVHVGGVGGDPKVAKGQPDLLKNGRPLRVDVGRQRKACGGREDRMLYSHSLGPACFVGAMGRCKLLEANKGTKERERGRERQRERESFCGMICTACLSTCSLQPPKILRESIPQKVSPHTHLRSR